MSFFFLKTGVIMRLSVLAVLLLAILYVFLSNLPGSKLDPFCDLTERDLAPLKSLKYKGLVEAINKYDEGIRVSLTTSFFLGDGLCVKDVSEEDEKKVILFIKSLITEKNALFDLHEHELRRKLSAIADISDAINNDFLPVKLKEFNYSCYSDRVYLGGVAFKARDCTIDLEYYSSNKEEIPDSIFLIRSKYLWGR